LIIPSAYAAKASPQAFLLPLANFSKLPVYFAQSISYLETLSQLSRPNNCFRLDVIDFVVFSISH